MEKKQFENNNFVLYSPDSLCNITNGMEQRLYNSLELYKKIFDVDNFRKVSINFFDNIDAFRNFIYEIRGETSSLPAYAKGTFDGGMINVFIDPNMKENTPLFERRKYVASHELFHIMYMELIWMKLNNKRITWFDEGMAQFFSGEYNKLLNSDEFYSFFNDTISHTKVIPNLNELSHKKSFETNDYSGYRLSLITVKYLYDTLGFNEFKKLLSDNNKITEYGNYILNEAIDYYKNKIEEENNERIY